MDKITKNTEENIEKLDDYGYEQEEESLSNAPFCPMCLGQNVIKEGHCRTCLDCGWSLCEV